jgi:peptidyl-prolyl cis-trans isomerase C
MTSVVVDGVELPETLIAQEIQNHPSRSAAEARSAAAHALAIRALLIHRGQQLDLKPEPEVDALGREETFEEALARTVLEVELSVTTPDHAECLRLYESQPDKFRTPALTEASHILLDVAADDPADEAAVRALASELIAQLRDNRARFVDLAKAHSVCPSGATAGGSLGQLRPGDLVSEVEAVLAKLAPGEVASEPVRSRFGWHVLRLDRRIEGRQLPFDLVEDRIRLHLESRAWTAAATRYVADLAAEARAQGVAVSLCEDGRIREGSLTLGEILEPAMAGARIEPWLRAVDPEFLQQVTTAAEAANLPLVEFVQDTVATFLAEASDEDWTKLISAARGGADPALAGLAALLRQKVAPNKPRFTIIRRA